MKKILSILLILMLIITFIQIRNMYALYKDELSGEYSTSLGNWNVKVNGKNIVSPGDIIEFDMTSKNVGYVDNSNIKFNDADVIAPDTEAFFDILFNITGTDTAVKYSIEVGETVADPLNGSLVGQILSYRIVDNATGNFVVDDTDDLIDDSATDYDFALKFPLKFEIQEVTDTFGSYSIIESGSNKGLIEGTETPTIYTKKNKVDKEKNAAIGVIPLEVGQSASDTDKVRIKFKWLSEEDEISDEEKEQLAEMYQELSEKNTTEQTVSFKIPIRVNAIQYLGEDL